MAELEEVKSKRDMMGERLKAKYPDREFADDEAMYGQISDDYDDYDRQLGEYKDREGKIAAMFSDPRGTSLLMGMKEGEDPAVGLMRRFGPELREFLDDPDKQEELAKAQADYLERITKEKELEDLYQKNFAESCDVVSEFQKEKGLTDEQVDELLAAVIGVGNEMVVGKFTRATLETFSKAMNYDSAVESAAAEGEVRGKNQRIEEKLRKPSRGDGTPMLDGRNGGTGKQSLPPNLGAIDQMSQGGNIFERGGMKRKKRY